MSSTPRSRWHRPPDGRPIDHDWMFQEPELFFSHLEELKLNALAS